MHHAKPYALPKLPYDYAALAPHISQEQLTLHHTKHHQAYVNGANALFEKFDAARKGNADFDVKAALKELSFHIGGYQLHNLFWQNLAPAGKGGGGMPSGDLSTTEGSGWAVLTWCAASGRPLIMQIEKHNCNVFPGYPVLMVLDVWEHAYYLDYKNDRGKFVEAFWNIVNWDEVARRMAVAVKG